MMIMPGNHTSMEVGRLCGMYPGRIGLLFSPGGWKRPPKWIEYAMDNGAYSAWKNKKPFDWEAFWKHCDMIKTVTKKPRWIAIPDVVCDLEATVQLAYENIDRMLKYNCPLAFVVQDGMQPYHVHRSAEVVFVGGSTEWKWKSLPMWTKHFPRVHVGRVNSGRLLWMAYKAGAESCDGTGWYRGNGGHVELGRMEEFLKQTQPGGIIPQMELQL